MERQIRAINGKAAEIDKIRIIYAVLNKVLIK